MVATKSDTSDGGTVVCRSELGECAPSTTNIEHSLAFLEADLLTDNAELVVLELFQALLLVDVGDDAGCVDHARAQEPAVEVITTIVVVSDLLLILRTSVHDHFRHHSSQEEPKEAQSEAEVGPVVSVFHNLKAVTVEVHLFVKVHLVECFHWNLVLATVLPLVFLALEIQVVLDGSAWVLGFLVKTRGHGRGDCPERHENGDGGQDGEEDPCEEATTDFVGEIGGDASEEGEEEGIVEGLAARTVCGQRSVLNRWVLHFLVSIRAEYSIA